jgi:hypothetical protein
MEKNKPSVFYLWFCFDIVEYVLKTAPKLLIRPVTSTLELNRADKPVFLSIKSLPNTQKEKYH